MDELAAADPKAEEPGAGARTIPRRHEAWQHMIVTDGTGVVADEEGVHLVRQGSAITNPRGVRRVYE